MAAMALRSWAPRRWAAAIGASIAVALLIGVPTVLIPNPVFTREIPTVPWNYPVWIITSLLTGMLVATYVRADRSPSVDHAADGGESETASEDGHSRVGTAGAIFAWFAVGCPVCNKIALLAFGYSGAITWFAPAQPYLAAVAVVLSGVALVRRLQGEVSCALPRNAQAIS